VRNAVTTIYERNAYVSEYAKRRANGICQLCEREAPFKNKDGELYLETHHVEWLSKGGTDTLDNTVALCPNCHRKMHVLDLEEDKSKLKLVAAFL
jgi:5-methylcytosine-specific restriction protein A